MAKINERNANTQDGGLERYQKLLAKADEVSLDAYLHWDELWHREPPKDISREEWWFLIKLQRQSSRQVVPLLEKPGAVFNFVLPACTPKTPPK